MKPIPGDSERPKLTLYGLLRPYARFFTIGIAAILVESATNLAEPWPLKIVLDNVLKSKPAHGWLNQLIVSLAGTDKIAILKLATLAVIAIAIVGAACNYAEKFISASLGQWITHDLRHTLYSHIHQLSLVYHNQKQTGDLVSRLTSDIDAVQSFIASGLLGALINSLTLAGMMAVMFCLSRDFTLIALCVVPPLFMVVFHYTHRIKAATRQVRKKEGEIVSVIQEVLSSIRVVKAFAREEYEQHRLEEESLEEEGKALEEG